MCILTVFYTHINILDPCCCYILSIFYLYFIYLYFYSILCLKCIPSNMQFAWDMKIYADPLSCANRLVGHILYLYMNAA